MIEASARLSKLVSKHATSHSAASSVTASATADIGLSIGANAPLDPSSVLLNQSNALLNLANALRNSGSHRLNEMDDNTYKYSVGEYKYRRSNEMEYSDSRTVRDSASAHSIPHLNSTVDREQISNINASRSNNNSSNNNSNNNTNSNNYHSSSETMSSTSSLSKKKTTSDIPSSVGILNQHSHHIARLSMKRVHDDVNSSQQLHMSHLNQHQDSYYTEGFIPNNSQLCSSVIPRSDSHFVQSHYGSHLVPTPSLSSSSSSSTSSAQSYAVIRPQGINSRALVYPQHQHQGDVSGLNLLRVCTNTSTNVNANINPSTNIDVRLLHCLSEDQIRTDNYINSISSNLPPKVINSNPLFTIPKTGSSATVVSQRSVDNVFVEKTLDGSY